jgi:hypothetical protein
VSVACLMPWAENENYISKLCLFEIPVCRVRLKRPGCTCAPVISFCWRCCTACSMYRTRNACCCVCTHEPYTTAFQIRVPPLVLRVVSFSRPFRFPFSLIVRFPAYLSANGRDRTDQRQDYAVDADRHTPVLFVVCNPTSVALALTSKYIPLRLFPISQLSCPGSTAPFQKFRCAALPS